MYAKSFNASPTELVNYLNNEKSSFKSVSLNGGFINANNFNSTDLLPSNKNEVGILDNFKFIRIQNIGITNFDILIDQQGNKYDISNDEIRIENFLIKNGQTQFSVTDFKSKINEREVSIRSDVLIKDSIVRFDFENLSYGNSIFTGFVHLINVNEIKKFKYDGYFKNSTLNSSDFNTPIKNLDIQIESFFEGNIDEIKFKDLKAKSLENELITDLFFKFSESLNDSDIALELKSFDSSTTFLYSLFPELFGTVIPFAFRNIGKLEMKGIFTKNDDIIFSNADIKTEFGVIDYDIKMSNLKNINFANYQGSFNGKSFDLAKIINLPFELQSDFNFNINGQGFDEENLKSSVVGQMNNVAINSYSYKKIIINGDVSDKLFTGSLIVDDDNLNLNFDGLINYSNDLVEYDFNTNIKKANLSEINLSKVEGQSVFGNIGAKLIGENFQSMIGDVSFTDFILTGLDDEYKFENLTIQSRINNEKRFFNIDSEDAVSGILIGDFNFLLLPTLMKNSIFSGYKNYLSLKDNSEFDLSFNLNLKPKFANIISKKFTIDQNTFLSGEFDTYNYNIKIQTPNLKFSKVIVDDFILNISNNSGNINISSVKSNYFNGKNIEISLAKIDDFTNIDLSFIQLDNSTGSLKFEHTINPDQRSEFLIKELAFGFNGIDWQLKKQTKGSGSNVLIVDDKYTELKPTNIFSSDQSIEFNYFDDENDFVFSSDFDNVEFSSIIPKPKNIFYEGKINGSIQLEKSDGLYLGSSDVSIESFSANSNVLGNAILSIDNSKNQDSYDLKFIINNKSKNIFDLAGIFKIEDDDYPMNFKLITKNFNIAPFSAIGENVLQNFEGHFNSDIDVTGTFFKPIFEGKINAVNSSFDIPYLGLRYGFVDDPTFTLNNQTININNFILNEKKSKTSGIMSGKISHNRLKDWYLDFKIESNNLLALNTQSSENEYYYGTGFLNGSANFIGPGKDLDIEINGTTQENTKIIIPIRYGEGLDQLSYLTFKENNNDTPTNLVNQGLEVFLNMNINKNAEIEIIFDEKSGSKISGFGNGQFNIVSDYSDNFTIDGEFSVESGYYFYKNFGIVERVFNLNKGASIVWNGDPYKGLIDAKARYSVPGGANPAPLIQNTSFNRKIPTYVDIELQGELSNLETPKFEIIFPNTSGSIKSELDYYLNDYEKKQTQAISLISQGYFINSSSSSLVSAQTITNNLFQRASGIIDDLLASDDDKMNLGINYEQGDKLSTSSLLNRDRIGLSLQSEISDKILINGKIGVPVSGMEENVILGNVQIDFLLNNSGSLRAKVFNKENEYQFFGDEIGFTQGFGIFYDVEFDSFSELLSSLKKTKKEK
ncbi:translocation/assembly module TamB [Flavobacteriales bacterium]|nr:translocation/assembly module TamB [Flavobacteriales bacterium]